MTKNLPLPMSATIIIGLVAIMMMAFVGLPASAQQTSRVENCTLVQDIKIDTTTYSQGDTIGPVGTTAPTGITAAKYKTTDDWSLICLLNTVYVITNWVFILLLALAIGLIALGGFLWMASGADANQKARATTMIQAAVVGFVIAILARFIPGLIQGLLF